MRPANLPPPSLLRLRMELQRHQDLTPAEAAEAAMRATMDRTAAHLATMAEEDRGRLSDA
jgi:hypothetical protein